MLPLPLADRAINLRLAVLPAEPVTSLPKSRPPAVLPADPATSLPTSRPLAVLPAEQAISDPLLWQLQTFPSGSHPDTG